MDRLADVQSLVNSLMNMQPQGRRSRLKMNEDLGTIIKTYEGNNKKIYYIDHPVFIMALEELCHEALILAEQQEHALMRGEYINV